MSEDQAKEIHVEMALPSLAEPEEKQPATAPEEEPAPASAAVEVFTIELDNAAGKLGMVVDLSEDYLIVTEIQPGGLSESWNKSCKPEEVIKIYDRITSVSGNTGKALELRTLLAEKTKLKIELAHSKETIVSLAQEEKKLGLKLSALRLGSHVLEVTSGGRIEAWNQANPAIAIKPGHRIMKVDDVGCTDPGGGQAVFDTVQAKAKAQTALELKFISWP